MENSVDMDTRAVYISIPLALLILTRLAVYFTNKQHITLRRKIYFFFIYPLFLVDLIFSMIFLYNLNFIDDKSIGILGVLVSFFFGLGGNLLLKLENTVRIGIAIPSKTEFNDEIIEEIAKRLAEITTKLDEKITLDYKDYSNGKIIKSIEFYELLDKMLEDAKKHSPDYLIVHCPNKGYANSNYRNFLDLLRGKTKIIFIETIPDFRRQDISKFGKNIFEVHFNSHNGAEVLSQQIKQRLSGQENIMLINGPKSSENATQRAEIIEHHLRENITSIYYATSWLPSSAREIMDLYRTNNQNIMPDIVVCGNDNIAIGVCDYLYENSLSNQGIKVIGFDGIRPAIERIKIPESTLWATLKIPPKQYGKQAVDFIYSDIQNNRDQELNAIILANESSFLTETDFKIHAEQYRY